MYSNNCIITTDIIHQQKPAVNSISFTLSHTNYQVLALTESKLGIIISFYAVARKVLSPDAQSPEFQDGA